MTSEAAEARLIHFGLNDLRGHRGQLLSRVQFKLLNVASMTSEPAEATLY